MKTWILLKKVKDIAVTSYRKYNVNVPQQLNKDEFVASKYFTNNKSSIIQNLDEDNSVVAIDRST